MDDAAVLLADRWVAAAALHRQQPTVLVRSSYGRRGLFGVIFGRLLAERGLQLVIQSVRGTFGSAGEKGGRVARARPLAARAPARTR
jgi:predicted acyl esterase